MNDEAREEDPMATLLDDALVTDALTNLPEWAGDAQRLSRTVRCDDPDDLVARVAEVADALDHHPVVERDGAAVTFVLWTHSKGGVTELDIALASRIDDIVLAEQHLQRGASGEVHATGAGGDGHTVTAAPNVDAGGQTTPSRPEESATGDPYPAGGGGGAPTFNEPANPRAGAGPVALPDSEPGSVEPQPGHAPAPGMHEETGEAG